MESDMYIRWPPLRDQKGVVWRLQGTNVAKGAGDGSSNRPTRHGGKETRHEPWPVFAQVLPKC